MKQTYSTVAERGMKTVADKVISKKTSSGQVLSFWLIQNLFSEERFQSLASLCEAGQSS